MKRLGSLALLMMLLSSSAYAGTYSFTYHGHRIRVERPRHCFSTSCLSVSVPGLRGTQHEDGVDDVAAASDAPTAKSPAAAPALSPVPLSATSPASTPVQAKPAASPPVAVAAQPSAPPAVPLRAESKVVLVEKRPPVEKLTVERPVEKPVEKPVVTAQTAPETVPPTANASQQASGEQADTPLGDWQTEGNKGLVRIEPCGSALCGYAVDTATNAKGETVLINMKPKGTSDTGASDWTGTIVSRASGNTYYAKMAIKQSNTLRVEACTVGRFFCSGNDWSRIVTTPQALITSRGIAAQPPS